MLSLFKSHVAPCRLCLFDCFICLTVPVVQLGLQYRTVPAVYVSSKCASPHPPASFLLSQVCTRALCKFVCLLPLRRRRFVEITALGLRDLASYGFQPIYLPFVEFDCGDRSRTSNQRSTKASKAPSGSNPNFLEVCGVCGSTFWIALVCCLVLSAPLFVLLHSTR